MRSTFRQLLQILKPAFRRRLVILQFLLLIGVVFESISLGMVLPMVGALIGEGKASPEWITGISRFFNFIPGNSLLPVLLAFVVFYFLKTIFLCFLVWHQSRFTTDLSQDISERLFQSYQSRPYDFFLHQHSAVLMKNIISEVNGFTAWVQALLQLQTELSIVTGIAVALLLLQPVAAIFIALFMALAGYGLVRLSRKRVAGWGKSKQQYDARRSKTILESLTGFREIKLFSAQSFFFSRFRNETQGYYRSQRNIQFLSQTQRYYLEFVVIVTGSIFCVASVLRGESFTAVLPMLSLFLFAALRLLPSVNRSVVSLQNMKFTEASISLIRAELKRKPVIDDGTKTGNLSVKDSIRLDNISYQFPDSHQPVIKNVTMELKAGSITGLIGETGSGKTTVANILTGLLTPAHGRILIDGKILDDLDCPLHQYIGYVPQQIFLIDDTLRRNIAFGITDDEIEKVRLQQVLYATKLIDTVHSMPQGLDTMIGERGIRLSGGQQQRIGIARALYRQAPALIIDEGTSALDVGTEDVILESITRLRGMYTILLITHRVQTLRVCDNIYKISSGISEILEPLLV